MTYLSHNPEETQRIASDFAKMLFKLETVNCKLETSIIITLEGELGVGKTTFIQAFAEALGVHEKVKSPTFVLMKDYPITNYLPDRQAGALRIEKTIRNPQSAIHEFRKLYHLDCYRLRDYKDLKVLGIQNILNNSGNIVLIEWAERVTEILPKQHWVVHIDHVTEQERNITIGYRS